MAKAALLGVLLAALGRRHWQSRAGAAVLPMTTESGKPAATAEGGRLLPVRETTSTKHGDACSISEIGSGCSFPSHWQATVPVKSDDEALGDSYSTTALGKTLFTEVLGRLSARHGAIKALGTDGHKWRQRQSAVKASLAQMFAPLPARDRGTPRVLLRGPQRGDGFSVERLLIETRPGYWAPAALWLPSNATGRVPAVLFPSGHSATSFREEGAQLIEQNLVRRGFAVLGYDPVRALLGHIYAWCTPS